MTSRATAASVAVQTVGLLLGVVALGGCSGWLGSGASASSGSGGSHGAGASAGASAGAGAGGASGGSGHVDRPFGGSITLDGRRLLVGGRALHLRGVCWHPIGKGGSHPDDLDFSGFASVDIPMMEAAGINAVRTYVPLTDRSVLDQFAAAGIYVLNGIYTYGGSDVSVVTERVNAVKDHPAILMWVIGNEWNYNGLYAGLSQAEAIERVGQAVTLAKAADADHPVATVYGELPGSDVLSALDQVDIWGINAYRGIGFGNLFDTWEGLSEKPMFLAEYGADAYNDLIDAYDPTSQAQATRTLTQELLDQSSALADGVALGGTIFEWADEWWKDESGSPDQHDVGGEAPGGGPYPDQTFNEEWWGVVDIDRNTRPAYDALRDLYMGE